MPDTFIENASPATTRKTPAIIENLWKYNWVYRRDLINRFIYGLHCPLGYQQMYCAPKDIRQHSTIVRHILPDHCATIPARLAKQSKELKKKTVRVIADGDWDTHHMPISEILPYRITLEKLASGQSWEAVGEYKRMEALIKIKGVNDQCRNRSDLDQRYAQMDVLAEYVRDNRRLKTRKELGGSYFREMGGINICIGRDGSLIKLQGGTHRLAIAAYFDIPAVPVCVRLVHDKCVRSGQFRELMRQSDALGGL